LAVFGLPERERLARSIEPLRHRVDLAADPSERRLETQAFGCRAVQMVEDAL
jgi:hypothetical protein